MNARAGAVPPAGPWCAEAPRRYLPPAVSAFIDLVVDMMGAIEELPPDAAE